MTRNGGFKRLVRERAQRTSESYSTARAHLRHRSAPADVELVTSCAAPIVRRMHAADPIARASVVPSLTRDQGTLLAFWILFTHADDGVTGLCRAHPHRMVDPDFWTLIDTALRDHAGLVAILIRLRAEIGRALVVAPGDADRGWQEFLDPGAMAQLDTEFEAAIWRSLHRMANHIRAHADRFPTSEVAAR